MWRVGERKEALARGEEGWGRIGRKGGAKGADMFRERRSAHRVVGALFA